MRLVVGLVFVTCVGCKTEYVRNVYCDGAEYKCEDPARPVCDLPRNLCVAADDMGVIDMSGDGGTDLADGSDAGCITASDCTSPAQPLCSAGGMCEACSGASDDARCAAKSAATPRCKDSAPMLGQCVQCRPATQAADCTTAAPICGSDGACRGCKMHSECPSGVCVLDGASAGQCAPENMVTYVDNTFAGCAAGNGARANPVCEVTTALVSGRPYISVKGSVTPYAAIATTTGTFAIVGPGKAANPTALLTSVTPAAGASVNPPSGSATLILDGLELTGTGGVMANRRAGVLCQGGSGTAAVTVRDCLIRNSGLTGVDATTCAVTLNKNIISGNQGGGISIGGTSTYTVTNNIVGSNGNVGPGVTIGSAATGSFAFNTVAGNTVTAGVSGIDCGAGAAKSIQYSIVASNASGNAGPQLGANCSATGVVMSGPEFASVSDFHLKAGSAANITCCVDKVSNPTTPNANVDVDGATRPKGAAHDTGAHEVQ